MMFETALQFLIPYMGWGIVILAVMIVLDVILTIHRSHGMFDLECQAERINEDFDELEKTHGLVRSRWRGRLKLFLYVCAWPIVVGRWLKVTYYGETTFVEKILAGAKKKIKEKKGE
ncbi:hypothetical protein HYV70_05140 [Candidatus Uhrbacteria bacterium]|nr:hypothetical protein [Candidatus Uhrbacteria bacterium]